MRLLLKATVQRGSAVITALLVVVLVVSVLVMMQGQERLAIDRTALITTAYQLRWQASGATAIGLAQLQQWADLPNDQQQILRQWPYQLTISPQQGMTTLAAIYDMTGRFNLNSLADATQQMTLTRLLLLLDPSLSLEQAQALTERIKNQFMLPGNGGTPTTAATNTPTNTDTPTTENTSSTTPGAETPSLPPFEQSGFPTISALRLVPGMSRTLFLALTDQVTALPKATPININTCSAVLLQSLAPAITAGEAQATIQTRQSQLYRSVADFLKFSPLKDRGISSTLISERGSYFLITANVKANRQQLLMLTIAELVAKQDKQEISVIWQSYNTL